MIKLILFIIPTVYSIAGIGNIMALKGTAKIQKKNNSMIAATSGMQIEQGDKIITENKTRAQIILKDDTIITIGENSTFQFDNFFFDGTKKSTVSMSTSRGFFRSVTGKIGKLAPERFKVKTSSATIGIRGTDFSVRLQNAIERFRCYSGGIRITFGDTHKDLKPGESFELNIHTLRAWVGQISGVNKDKDGLQGIDPADLNNIEKQNSDDVTYQYPRPDPIIPPGVPCQIK